MDYNKLLRIKVLACSTNMKLAVPHRIFPRKIVSFRSVRTSLLLVSCVAVAFSAASLGATLPVSDANTNVIPRAGLAKTTPAAHVKLTCRSRTCAGTHSLVSRASKKTMYGGTKFVTKNGQH